MMGRMMVLVVAAVIVGLVLGGVDGARAFDSPIVPGPTDEPVIPGPTDEPIVSGPTDEPGGPVVMTPHPPPQGEVVVIGGGHGGRSAEVAEEGLVVGQWVMVMVRVGPAPVYMVWTRGW